MGHDGQDLHQATGTMAVVAQAGGTPCWSASSVPAGSLPLSPWWAAAPHGLSASICWDSRHRDGCAAARGVLRTLARQAS